VLGYKNALPGNSLSNTTGKIYSVSTLPVPAWGLKSYVNMNFQNIEGLGSVVRYTGETVATPMNPEVEPTVSVDSRTRTSPSPSFDGGYTVPADDSCYRGGHDTLHVLLGIPATAAFRGRNPSTSRLYCQMAKLNKVRDIGIGTAGFSWI